MDTFLYHNWPVVYLLCYLWGYHQLCFCRTSGSWWQKHAQWEPVEPGQTDHPRQTCTR